MFERLKDRHIVVISCDECPMAFLFTIALAGIGFFWLRTVIGGNEPGDWNGYRDCFKDRTLGKTGSPCPFEQAIGSIGHPVVNGVSFKRPGSITRSW